MGGNDDSIPKKENAKKEGNRRQKVEGQNEGRVLEHENRVSFCCPRIPKEKGVGAACMYLFVQDFPTLFPFILFYVVVLLLMWIFWKL